MPISEFDILVILYYEKRRDDPYGYSTSKELRDVGNFLDKYEDEDETFTARLINLFTLFKAREIMRQN